jgi:hypothetical protein
MAESGRCRWPERPESIVDLKAMLLQGRGCAGGGNPSGKLTQCLNEFLGRPEDLRRRLHVRHSVEECNSVWGSSGAEARSHTSLASTTTTSPLWQV